MAPAPTTHRIEYTVELEHRIIGPSPGGVYQNQVKEEHDTNESLKEENPPESLFENNVPLQIKDKAPLV